MSSISYGINQQFYTDGEFYRTQICKLDTNKVAVVYWADTGTYSRVTGYVKVGTISGSTITWGNPYSFNSTIYIDSIEQASIISLDSTHIVVAYKDRTYADYTYNRVGEISGTEITWGTPNRVYGKIAMGMSSLCALSSSLYSCSANYPSPVHSKTVLCSVSGTTITAGTAVDIKTGDVQYISSCKLSTDKYLIAFNDNTDGYKGKTLVVESSGTGGRTATIGSLQTFSSNVIKYIDTCYISEDKFGLSYFDNTDDYGYVRICTVLDTTVTFGTAKKIEESTGKVEKTKCETIDSSNLIVAYNDDSSSPILGNTRIMEFSGTDIRTVSDADNFYSDTTNLPSFDLCFFDTDKIIVAYGDTNGNAKIGTIIIEDIYTKLLCHFDGTNGATTTKDSSGVPRHDITFNGDAQLDTSQKVFGISSLLLVRKGATAGDYISLLDSDDWNMGSEDFTIDFWMKRTSVSSTWEYICGQSNVDFGGELSFVIRLTLADKISFGISTNGTSYTLLDSDDAIDDTDWHHLEVCRNGSTMRIFIDGVASGTTTISGTMNDSSSILAIGRLGLYNHSYYNGRIDEFRISKGIARHSSNFTVPSYPYQTEVLEDEDTIYISDLDEVETNPIKLELNDTIIIADEIDISIGIISIELGDTVYIGDDYSIIAPSAYSSKIRISGNYAYIVTKTKPIHLIKADISGTPTFDVEILEEIGEENLENANDIVINETSSQLYIASDNGQIIKAPISDITSRTIIDSEVTNDLTSIDCVDDFKLTYAGTELSTGQLIRIDESTITNINTKFTVLKRIKTFLNATINFIYSSLLNTKFSFLSKSQTLLNTDIRFLTSVFEDIVPSPQTSFHVYIDSIELEDVNLDSISISYGDGNYPTANFTVARYHDKPDNTLAGDSFILSGQKPVEIKFGDKVLFTGIVSSLNCVMDENEEYVNVQCRGATTGSRLYNYVTLPLSSNDEHRKLYDVILNDIQIEYPRTEGSNPEKYRGIKINLGTEIKENVIRYVDMYDVVDEVNSGTFEYTPNWEYYWFAGWRKVLDNVTMPGSSNYIGTSLSPFSTDIYEILYLSHMTQKVLDNDETSLGYYYYGSTPYMEISTRNGKYIPKEKWEDKQDGLYRVKAEGYDYTEYCKLVARMEYNKLKSINGNVTSTNTDASISLTIDAFLFYNIHLDTRVNLDNTMTTNIFKNANGFPLSVKGYTINSSTMTATITCDEKRSLAEMDAYDTFIPEEDSSEFNTKYKTSAINQKVYQKYDPVTGDTVE